MVVGKLSGLTHDLDKMVKDLTMKDCLVIIGGQMILRTRGATQFFGKLYL